MANHPILDWAIKEAFERLQSSSPPGRNDPTFQDAVLSLTGPGLFTDAVFWYLDSEFGISMKDLKGLDEPRTIGDVLILPQTAFSPEMPHIHSYSNSHPNSLVKHMFGGSWKYPAR